MGHRFKKKRKRISLIYFFQNFQRAYLGQYSLKIWFYFCMRHVVFETCYTCCISLVIILPVDGDESRKKIIGYIFSPRVTFPKNVNDW